MQPRYPANKDADAAFDAKLRQSIKEIAAEANGRVCGTCRSAQLLSDGEGICTLQVNMMGDQLRIYRPTAYACKAWTDYNSKQTGGTPNVP